MSKFVSFRVGLFAAATLAMLALGIAYALQIQRGVSGAVIIGRVQTAEETLLLYNQPPPNTADLTQLNFGTVDVNAFGLFTSPPQVSIWVENGGDIPFAVRLQVTDVEINGGPVARDVLALPFKFVGLPPEPEPTAAPAPTAVPAPTVTPTAAPTAVPAPTATPTSAAAGSGAVAPSASVNESVLVDIFPGFRPTEDGAGGAEPAPPSVLPLVTPTPTPTPTFPPTPTPTAPPPPPAQPVLHPGDVHEFIVGLRFLGTPEELGINTGDTLTFTALFTAQAILTLPTPTPTPTAFPTPTPTLPGPIVPSVDRLVVALPPPSVETNVPWAMPSFNLTQLRPALEHLVGINRPTGEYILQLAEGWAMSANGMQWEFYVRSGTPFHGGWGGFTSRDVSHSLDMIRSADSLATSAQFWRDSLAGVEIIDDATVRLNLTTPEPEMIDYVSANRDLVMLSKEFWDKAGRDGYEDFLIGTGSYGFTERVVGQHVLYDRVGNHWRRNPDFPELQMLYADEAATRLALMLTGQAHMADLPRSVHPQAEEGGLRVVPSQLPAVQVAWFMGGQYYTTNQASPPFDDPRVRWAMNAAIDREAINRALFRGRGEIMSVVGFHPSLPGWDPNWQPYPYDPDLARALLAEAGYAEGFPLTLYAAPQFEESLQISEILAQMFAELGLQPSLVVTDFAVLFARFQSRDMHGAMGGFAFSRVQPHRTIELFNYSDGLLHGYETSELDALYERFQATVDSAEEREVLLRAMGQHKYANYAEIPLLWLTADMVVDPDIVADYVFPGSISGIYTHLEYVVPVPR